MTCAALSLLYCVCVSRVFEMTKITFQYLAVQAVMSKSAYATYEWAVASLRFNLSIMGLWKRPKNHLDNILNTLPILLLNTFLLICHIIPQLWGLSRIYKYFEYVFCHLMSVVTFTFSMFKMFFLLSKTKVIHGFFERIEEDWNSVMTDKERFIMMKYWKLTKFIHLYGFLAGVFLASSYHCTVLFGFVLRIPTNLTDTIPGRYLAYYNVYPYDVQPTPYFELTAANEALGALLICVALVVTDVLYSALVLHTCAQLDILCRRIEAIADHQSQNVLQLMGSYIQHHLRIIRFAKDIDNLYNGILLLVFLHFTLGFCSQACSALLLITQHLEKKERFIQVSFFIIFSSYLLFCPFIYCWAGEKLLTKSENICFAVYNCNWMDLPPSSTMLLGLIAVRAQKPLAVSAGKFLPITLNTYAKLIKTCCGYISMLHALNR